MSEQRCVRGHGVPAGFRFCGICDGAIERAPAFAAVGSATPRAASLTADGQPPRQASAAPLWRDAPAPRPLPPPPQDPSILHLLRFIGVNMIVGASCYLLVGFFWMAHICNRTGARKRDVLSVFVPLVGAVFHARAMWRYTARHAYWSPRSDRPSDVLRGSGRPWAIAGGWVVIALLVAAVVVGGVGSASPPSGWPPEEREALVQAYIQGGLDRPTAACVVDSVMVDMPDAYGLYDDAFVDLTIDKALRSCGVPGA